MTVMVTKRTKTKPKMVRLKEICEELGMSTDAGYAHLRSGTFPIELVKVGGIWKGRRAELERFVSGDDEPTSGPDP
jgi:hypothetical protein